MITISSSYRRHLNLECRIWGRTLRRTENLNRHIPIRKERVSLIDLNEQRSPSQDFEKSNIYCWPFKQFLYPSDRHGVQVTFFVRYKNISLFSSLVTSALYPTQSPRSPNGTVKLGITPFWPFTSRVSLIWLDFLY